MRHILVLTLAAGLAACAGAAPPPPPKTAAIAAPSPAAERGRRFAEQRCAACHEVGLDSVPGASGPPFRDLRLRYNALSLQRRFAQVSQHGFNEMPPVEIQPSVAEDLIAYFESLPPSAGVVRTKPEQ